MKKIIWRKKEFSEFIGRKKWAFKRRRVSEIPAYLRPIGFGFSIVTEIHQGYLMDELGNVYIGFIPSDSNFHYFPAVRGGCRSDLTTGLTPISFVRGHHEFIRQILKAQPGDCKLGTGGPQCPRCGWVGMQTNSEVIKGDEWYCPHCDVYYEGVEFGSWKGIAP